MGKRRRGDPTSSCAVCGQRRCVKSDACKSAIVVYDRDSKVPTVYVAPPK